MKTIEDGVIKSLSDLLRMGASPSEVRELADAAIRRQRRREDAVVAADARCRGSGRFVRRSSRSRGRVICLPLPPA